MSDAAIPRVTSAALDESAASNSSEPHEQEALTCILRKKHCEPIATTLERASRFSNIEELELRSLELDQISALHLDTLFSGCQGDFQRLTLKNCCALSDKLFSLSTERLAQNSVHLTHFAMKNCSPLSMTSLISMSALFSSSLTSLELSSCKLARQAGIILSQSLPSCRALRRLVLADNNLRDGGLRAIVDALKGMFTIEPIQANCKDCDEDEEDEDLEGWTGLDELDISRNGVTIAGFSAFSHVPVRHLNASENAIESIGPFLLTNASIRSLDLSGNALSDDGTRELIITLFRDQTSLESLDLRGCALSGTSMSFLRKTLRQSTCCSLKALELDQVSDGPADDLVERRQCLDEIVQVGSQKYPHLKVRLSKAAPVLPSLQENRQYPGARGGATKQPSAGITGTEVLPLDTTELREAVATIVSSVATPGAQEISQPSHSPAKRGSQSQPYPQQQHFPVTPSALSSLSSAQPITRGASSSSSLEQHLQLQHVDVEYIVSKTIECMNQNFEQRLGLFLMKMESQQHDKNATQVQFLAAKVDTCERAIPRLEARLDVLSDRVAAGSAQLAKLQNEFQLQLQQVRQNVLSAQKERHQANQQQQQQLTSLAPTTPLSLVMQSQVEDFVTARARASEQLTLGEVHKLRRETNPQAIVDAVSSHLTQFKQEFDANQSSVLCKFTESIVKDSVRLDERVHKVEAQIGSLESVIQAEQQASLLALEAISEAFAASGGDGGGNENGSEPAPAPVRTIGYGTPTRTGIAAARRR